jgi:hypothetical protein
MFINTSKRLQTALLQWHGPHISVSKYYSSILIRENYIHGIGWIAYWVLYRVQTETVVKPIHLFPKIKKFLACNGKLPVAI